MKRVLLVNPSYYADVFGKAKVRAAIAPGTTPLGLSSLAGFLRREGHEVRLCDLNVSDDPARELETTLAGFRPDLVGVTATTPLAGKACEIAAVARRLLPGSVLVVGGPHASALPEAILEESAFDCVVAGEGEVALSAIARDGASSGAPGVWYRRDGSVVQGARGEPLRDLDALAEPAYDLLDLRKYRQPRIASRHEHVAYLETSRGCYARCVFCNKNIHGTRLRTKSPARVVGEMARMRELGFGEIHFVDDCFTADLKRAQAICEEILHRGLRMSWYPRGGIRVDRVTREVLTIMKRAGCYRIPFGIESGCQRVLDLSGKGITLEQAHEAVALAKEAGFETECYFMLGLPSETERDLEASIELALRLDPTYAKFAFVIPFPGTALFDDLDAKGRIKTRDWSRYTFATMPGEIYDHDTLSWPVLERYGTVSVRRFYFRPRYLARMIMHTLRQGTFWAHVRGFLGTDW